MVKKAMYYKIQKLKKMGFNKSEIAIKLELSRKTVIKYYKMQEEEYKTYQKELLYRDKELNKYLSDILEIYKINEYRKLNVAAIYDYLEEKNGALSCSEKTLRNYIQFLIHTGKLKLKLHIRQYSKVPELSYGKQMQLDFGYYRLNNGTTLYIFAAILSASRYKYVAIQLMPFTAKTVINHLLDTFIYFGGRPKELVIDQDTVMVVSENRGDIIYTKDFQYFIDEMELSMYVCRKADPESKGKIENTIKYIKYNFLDIRKHLPTEEITAALPHWLKRRANGKISQATKRIPLELVTEERNHLRPLINSIFAKESLTGRENRTVDDKSYISVSACSYSVPTHYKNRNVEIFQTSNRIFVFDIYSGKEIANHELSAIPGQKITDKSHFREMGLSSQDLKKEVLSLVDIEKWEEFAKINFKAFPRYVRDQCLDAKKYFSNIEDLEPLHSAIDLCLSSNCLTYANLHDVYQHFLNNEFSDSSLPTVSFENRNFPSIAVNKRDLEEYSKSFLLNQEVSYENV